MDDLALALALADRADEITMDYFRRDDLDVRTKPDRSHVTEADLAAERALREILRDRVPSDGVIGEEFDETPGGGRRWIIDPIDHTNNYTRGIEVFATLIGLEVHGEITVGVVSSPAMGRRWWASRGDGAYVSEAGRTRRLAVSAVDDLAEAHVSFAALERWGDLIPDVAEICGAAHYTFGSGGFWAQMLVAEGRCDAALDPWGKLWDNAAIQMIVEEAGGRFTDLADEPRIDQDCAIVTNGVLHEEILTRLNARRRGLPGR